MFALSILTFYQNVFLLKIKERVFVFRLIVHSSRGRVAIMKVSVGSWTQVADMPDLLRAATVILQPRMPDLTQWTIAQWGLSAYLCPPRTCELSEGRGQVCVCTEGFMKSCARCLGYNME